MSKSSLAPQDYGGVFKGIFGGGGFGDQQRLEQRHQRERKAGRTLKQRERKAKRTAVINIRVEPELKDLVALLAKHKNCSQADVVHEAIRVLATQAGLTNAGGTDAP